METKLARISQLLKENPGMVFTSLGHLINAKRFYEHLKHRKNRALIKADILNRRIAAFKGRSGQNYLIYSLET